MEMFIKTGRFLLAIPMAIFGLLHFMAADKMGGMVPIPGGAIWVYITGLALIAAAVSIIMQKKARLAATLLAVMLLIFVALIHAPAVAAGGDGGQMAMASLLKDIAIAGGALVYAGTQPQE
ncbi:MAG: DoxX family protein [Spirosomataceae bacterium]